MGDINQIDSLGRRQGLWIEYYNKRSNRISVIKNFLNGKLHGEYISFYGNGVIFFKVNCLNGFKVDYQPSYKENNNFDDDMFFQEIF
jgi:antitoxin component YwqK of YwqJK toxin-antitoxin module